jgi:hypothetical protein
MQFNNACTIRDSSVFFLPQRSVKEEPKARGIRQNKIQNPKLGKERLRKAWFRIIRSRKNARNGKKFQI